MADFVPMFGVPKARPEEFKPASFAPATEFVSLYDQVSRKGGEPDFVPDLGSDLEAEAEEPDLEQLLQEARAAGAAEARAEARGREAELRREVEALRQELETVSAAAEGIGRVRAEALQQAGNDLAALVLAMARKVVGDALALNPEALEGVVREALDKMPDEDDVVVRARPEELELLQRRLRLQGSVRMVSDPELEGGCIVSAGFSEIDASLDAAMEGLSEAVYTWRMENEL